MIERHGTRSSSHRNSARIFREQIADPLCAALRSESIDFQKAAYSGLPWAWDLAQRRKEQSVNEDIHRISNRCQQSQWQPNASVKRWNTDNRHFDDQERKWHSEGVDDPAPF
jgi:hypothetical protein